MHLGGIRAMAKYFHALVIIGIAGLVWTVSLLLMLAHTDPYGPYQDHELSTKSYEVRVKHQHSLFDPQALLVYNHPEKGVVHFRVNIPAALSYRDVARDNTVIRSTRPDKKWIISEEIDFMKEYSIKIGSLYIHPQIIFWVINVIAIPIVLFLWLTHSAAIKTPEERAESDKKHIELIKELEGFADENPKTYRRKIYWLAIMGFAVIGGLFLGLISAFYTVTMAVLFYMPMSAGTIKLAIFILLPLGYCIGAIMLSMRIPEHREYGFSYDIDYAPEKLKAFIKKIESKGHGPKIQRVTLSSDLNASIGRDSGFLGLLGKGPVEMTLGIPLMCALNTQQLAAVIGHEYGHIANTDDKLGQWVYRIRRSWRNMEDILYEEPLWHKLKLSSFLDWYVPYFSAYTFVSSRQCEYEADAFGAMLTDNNTAIDTLSRVAVLGRYYDGTYWDEFWEQANSHDKPPVLPFKGLASLFKKDLQLGKHLEAARANTTGYYNTHPATIDRIKALGGDHIPAPQKQENNAAEALLDDKLDDMLKEFDEDWWEYYQDDWQHRHKSHNEDKKQLEELKAKFKQGGYEGLSEDEHWDLAANIYHVERDYSGAEPHFRKYRERDPSAIGCDYYLARILLERNDDEGYSIIDQLLRNNERDAGNILDIALYYAYEPAKGDDQSARYNSYKDKADYYYYRDQAAREERNILTSKDTFIDSTLSAEYCSELTELLSAQPRVKKAWLAEKELQYSPEERLHILYIECKYDYLARHTERVIKELREACKINVHIYLLDDQDYGYLESSLKKKAFKFYHHKDQKKQQKAASKILEKA